MEVTIRPAKLADKNFILSTWLRNYRHSSHFAKSIRTSVYFEWHHKVALGIMTRDSTFVRVLCDATEPDLILGYVVSEGPVLHYIYVKKGVRGFGLAKKLMHAAFPNGLDAFEFTHLTDDGAAWLKAHPDKGSYNPYKV